MCSYVSLSLSSLICPSEWLRRWEEPWACEAVHDDALDVDVVQLGRAPHFEEDEATGSKISISSLLPGSRKWGTGKK